jgi:two-component system phosphate regulon sensor histidine kinase PhoR
MLEEMRKQSQRMAQLVEDLLTLSRLESQEHSEEETVAMQPMLATLRREAEAHSQGRHQISIDDLAGVDLQGSTKELHSAFSNLVTNAVRYTPAGGRIAVEFRREGDGAVLAVRDSGYGIPATHLPRLTERFYRVQQPRARAAAPGWACPSSSTSSACTTHGWRLKAKSARARCSPAISMPTTCARASPPPDLHRRMTP